MFDLERRLSELSRRSMTFGEEPKELRQVVRALQRQINRLDPTPSSDLREAAVLNFMKTGRLKDARETRNVCFSVTQIVGDAGERVLAYPQAIEILLSRVKRLSPGWKRRCYQGLLSAYFGEYNGSRAENRADREAWDESRTYLDAELTQIVSRDPSPAWALELTDNRELLTRKPCDRFAIDLLQGQDEAFDRLCATLEISKSCWLRIEAAMAATKEGCSKNDEAFKDTLDNLLALVERYPIAADECLGLILTRYSTMPQHSEHSGLLRKSVSLWGNPLHTRNLVKWDRAGDKATNMVRAWLKESLIEDFFAQLSSDGATDRRRVNFWKRYAPFIDDMYFALGSDAMRDRSEDAIRLRKTMGDHLARLDGPSQQNNAFLMQIGDFIVVEFALTGNAAFVFDRERLPFDLGPAIADTGKLAWRRVARVYWRHTGLWENDFASDIERVLRISDPRRTATRASGIRRSSETPDFEEAELRAICLQCGVPYQKLSPLWFRVLAGDRNAVLTAKLQSWGFKYQESSVEWIWAKTR